MVAGKGALRTEGRDGDEGLFARILFLSYPYRVSLGRDKSAFSPEGRDLI